MTEFENIFWDLSLFKIFYFVHNIRLCLIFPLCVNKFDLRSNSRLNLSMSMTKWRNGTVPKSICSENCATGHIRNFQVSFFLFHSLSFRSTAMRKIKVSFFWNSESARPVAPAVHAVRRWCVIQFPTAERSIGLSFIRPAKSHFPSFLPTGYEFPYNLQFKYELRKPF